MSEDERPDDSDSDQDDDSDSEGQIAGVVLTVISICNMINISAWSCCTFSVRDNQVIQWGAGLGAEQANEDVDDARYALGFENPGLYLPALSSIMSDFQLPDAEQGFQVRPMSAPLSLLFSSTMPAPMVAYMSIGIMRQTPLQALSPTRNDQDVCPSCFPSFASCLHTWVHGVRIL